MSARGASHVRCHYGEYAPDIHIGPRDRRRDFDVSDGTDAKVDRALNGPTMNQTR